MTAAYPLGLRTVLRSKRRRSPAAFSMQGARRGTGYVTATGTAPPQFWDVTFKFTRDEAATFQAWFSGTINRGADEFTMPLLTEFGTLTHTLRFLPDSLLPVTEEGEVWAYTATLMSRAQIVPEGAPSSAGLTTEYPLALPTILQSTKRRTQAATFGVSDAFSGYAYAEETGPDVPVVWDISLRMTRDQAALLQVWFIDILERGVKPFTMPIKTEIGLISHVCQFMPAGLLQTSEDGEVVTYTATITARSLRLSIFDLVLADLRRNIRPMSASPTVPRWEPDTPSGVEWFVRPLQEMATVEATADRFTALDESALDYDAGDSGTWTTFFNHPLAASRNTNPIDPASVVCTGYASKTWTGTPVAMSTEVLLDTTTSPPDRLYYIRSSRGPGFVDPVDSLFKGTATVTWRYADLAVLDGTTYAKAWPGFDAIDWSVIGPGDTLWVCGTFEDETLQVGESGTAGAYIRIRFDREGTPGRIDQGTTITGEWTASGDSWWTPVQDVTECMLYEGEERLIGVNTRSRCRVPVTAVDDSANTISFGNIRRVQTGQLVHFGSDQVWEESLPAGLLPNTPYYCIVISSNWAFYTVTQAQYTVKLAASYADAIAGTAIDIGPKPVPSRNLLIFVQQHDYPFYDPVFSDLDPGQYAVDVENQRLYYRPTTGTPADHVVRIASESYAAIGACIYGLGRSYIKILGGGEYGGLFDDTPAPVGRVGFAHQDAIAFDTGSNIVVDGMLIKGCRSGVNFIDIEDGTIRNCRIRDCAHHASGGEDLTGTQEPGLLIERNWITEIGNKHEFGDAQAAVTNPSCDGSIFRRNYAQSIGRNTKVSNPAVFVFDGSANVSCYLNWADYCYGKTVEMDAGNGDPVTINGVIAINIITRQGQGDIVDRDDNLVQRTGAIHINLNGPTDPGISGTSIFGNLIAYTTIGVRAPDTLDDCGLIYQRTNNNDGTYDGVNPSANEIDSCTRNAFLFVTGPVFSRQKNTNASSAPWPTLVSDGNLFVSTPDFAIKASSGTILGTWSSSEAKGGTGTWQDETGGNEAASRIMNYQIGATRSTPTTQELEILRLFDAYDTYDVPTEDMIGDFLSNLI